MWCRVASSPPLTLDGAEEGKWLYRVWALWSLVEAQTREPMAMASGELRAQWAESLS